jgi:hypothetical protein
LQVAAAAFLGAAVLVVTALVLLVQVQELVAVLNLSWR